jgi:transcription-repair coupling factor (superfamily II helicase)
MPAYRQLVAKLRQPNGSSRVAALDAAKPYLIAALYHSLRRPIFVVTAQPEDGKKLYEQLLTWCRSNQTKLLPELGTLPYQRVASDTSTELERLQVLSALANIESTADAPLVVASAPALMQKTAPHSGFTSACHTIKVGMDIEPLELLSQWQAMGYRMESIVGISSHLSC